MCAISKHGRIQHFQEGGVGFLDQFSFSSLNLTKIVT